MAEQKYSSVSSDGELMKKIVARNFAKALLLIQVIV